MGAPLTDSGGLGSVGNPTSAPGRAAVPAGRNVRVYIRECVLIGQGAETMSEMITIAAVGDVNLADYIRPQTNRHGPAWAFEPCLQLLQADLLFGNLECVTFRPHWPDEPPNVRESFHLSWDEALGLERAGFSVLNLANNHILDYGTDCGVQTAEFCRQHGIAPVGFGATSAEARKPALLERKGVRVAFLGYVEDMPGLRRQASPGPAYLREPEVRHDIAATRAAGADIIVVSLHADLEFSDHPAPHRVALSRRLIDAGADVLLEHHPHVPQGIEEYGGGLIVYSLGNFVFPVDGDPYLEQGSPWTDRTFIVRVRVDKGGYRSHELVPVRIEPAGRPVPMTNGHIAELLARHERLSRDLHDPAALRSAWDHTSRRWWQTNLEWLVGAAREHGVDYAASQFLQELFYDENRPWLRHILRQVVAGMPPRAWEGPGRRQPVVRRPVPAEAQDILS